MNGYDAQDMATQGAEGFRSGYKAGDADAVKAVEVGKPAAAQEAVAKVGSDHFRSIVDWLGPIPPPNTLLYVAPVTAAPDEMSPEFTDTARAAIAWVLWHHQGGSSPVGQPLRFALGMGADEPLPDWRIAEAKRYAEWAGATTAKFHEAPATDEQYADADALIAHLDGLMDDGGQGGEKWEPAQAAIAGIRAWQAGTPAAPGIDLSPFRELVEVCEDVRAASDECDIGEGLAHAVPFHLWNEFLSKLDAAQHVIDASPKGDHSERSLEMVAPVAAPADADPFGQESYKRMLLDACSALAEVSRELGCDPEQGGAEPILAAIAKLKASRPATPGIDLEQLRRNLCIIGVVGQIDGHDVIRRSSMLDIVDRARKIDASPKGDVHPDDLAVDAFAAAMKAKLAAARAKGRGGWQCDEAGMQQRLSDMLRAHVEKGDPRDVANFCMFLHQRGESISPKGGSEAAEAAMFRWIRDNCEVEHQNWQYLPDDPMVVPLAERVSAAMQAQAGDAEVQP